MNSFQGRTRLTMLHKIVLGITGLLMLLLSMSCTPANEAPLSWQEQYTLVQQMVAEHAPESVAVQITASPYVPAIASYAIPASVSMKFVNPNGDLAYIKYEDGQLKDTIRFLATIESGPITIAPEERDQRRERLQTVRISATEALHIGTQDAIGKVQGRPRITPSTSLYVEEEFTHPFGVLAVWLVTYVIDEEQTLTWIDATTGAILKQEQRPFGNDLRPAPTPEDE